MRHTQGNDLKFTKHYKKKVIFVIGLPGTGKSTLCKDIAKKYDNYLHLSTGDVLRRIVEEKKEPHWKELEMKMNSGGLVESSDVMPFLKKTISTTEKEYIILDGFPRTKDNIDSWNENMSEISQVVAVLYFFCTDDIMRYRLMNRKTKREDDRIENMTKRKEMFEKETYPLLKVFEKDNKPIIKINTEKEEMETFSSIEDELKKNKLI